MGWSSVLTALIPLALLIALSPPTVIPAILVLHTPRPRPAGLAFTAGWLAGMAALTALFVGISGLLGGLHRPPPAWASWLRIALGVALIGYGGYRWVTRERHAEMPRWLKMFTTLTPVRALVTGAVLAMVRPEMLLLCAAAGLAIGSAGLEGPEAALAAGVFVVVGSSTVVGPVLGYVAAGDRFDPVLNRLKGWLAEQHATMVAVVLVLIGAIVLYNGLHAL